MSINSFENYHLTWKPIKEELTRPIYLSLANSLKDDIRRGVILPGTKLPSQRELADYLDLSFTTITRVYNLCKKEGFLYGEVGSGTYVSNNVNNEITISKNSVSSSTIDLGFISSLDETLPCVVKTIKQTANLRYLENLLTYNDPSGMIHQKKIFQNTLKEMGILTKVNNLFITSGSQNALAIVLIGVFNPGDSIAVDEYTYANFISLSRLLNIELIPIENDHLGMVPEFLRIAASKTKIKGIFIMPSFANPTGITMPLNRKKELSSLIKELGLLVIEDDVYGMIVNRGTRDRYVCFHTLIPEQTFYITGLSKPLYSGLRVGLLVAPNRFFKKIEKTIFNVNVKTSGFEIEIGSQLITSGQADKVIDKKIEILRTYNRIFERYFPDKATSNFDLYSFHRWLKIDTKFGSEIEEDILKVGVQVFHSSRFYSGTQEKESYLRVSLGSVNSKEELNNGLALLNEVIN